MLLLDASGKLLREVSVPAIITANSAGSVSSQDLGLATDGDVFFIAWEDVRNSPSAPPSVFAKTTHDIFAARIANDGTILDPGAFQVAAGGMSMTHPAVGFDGSNYLVTWNEAAEIGIRGIRVDRSGAVIDAASIPIGAGGGATVVWGKDCYLVTWKVGATAITRRLKVGEELSGF